MNFFVELDAGEDAEERVDQEQDDKPAEGQVMPRYRPPAMVWRDGVAQPGSWQANRRAWTAPAYSVVGTAHASGDAG